MLCAACLYLNMLMCLYRQAAKVWHLVLNGADTTLPYIHHNTSKTVWQLCDGDAATREALLHFWTPQTHKLHPRWTKNAIVWYACVLDNVTVKY